ncbi:MAG: DNA repair protein RecN [Chitinophagaceae bacterium]|nr:DNA repair protein RecN [Chitinophagaceae bacterium]MCA6497500.1 DNA repair protein RecN [Chitinophagaceae bacterium]
MLHSLHIQNYAIIDDLSILFSGKLNIITGETGAGKSILMGALGLILGERADSSVLLNREKKCCIEGCFKWEAQLEIREWLTANDLEDGEELLLRREIAASGKSRAFINDTPVTLQQLRELGSKLVDLHRQFDTLELGDTEFQRSVVDALTREPDLLQQYQKDWKVWQADQHRLDELKNLLLKSNQERDYKQFLLDELESFAPKEEELEKLDRELTLLNNSGQILQVLSRMTDLLRESDQPILPQLKQGGQALQGFAEMIPALKETAARLQSVQIELDDIADELDKIKDDCQVDETRVEWINERLADGYKLLKKHAVRDTNGLIALLEQLREDQVGTEKKEEELKELELKVAAAYDRLSQRATKLTAARKKVIPPFQEQVKKLLERVGMPNAALQVSLISIAPNHTGADHLEFLFDANRSGKWEPLKKVASGGELSRLMLCIKSLVAASMQLPTLIFDEIDSGISGEAARQVGLIMKELANNHQLICITHQPQIAGKADAHFWVYKEEKASGIHTGIRQLTEEERVAAIASMLSGEAPSEAALANAREMIRS